MITSFDEILTTADVNESGKFVDVDLKHTGTITKTQYFPIYREPKKVIEEFFTDFLKNIPRNRLPTNKLICDWND